MSSKRIDPDRTHPTPSTGNSSGHLLWLILVAVVLLAGCGRECVDMPGGLQGIWTTSHPLYSERFLEIRLLEVVLGVGGGESTTHTVVCVEAGEAPAGLFGRPYRIIYLAEDGEELSLKVKLDVSAGELRLANRDQVTWRRRDRSPS